MSDPIKAALAEAQMHAVGNDGEPICPAPIIAAFLRALPVTRNPTLEECQRAQTTTVRPRIDYSPDYLVDAVERAAHEGNL